MEEILVKAETGTARTIECRFGSFRAQSAIARLFIRWNMPSLSYRFGVDPLSIAPPVEPERPRVVVRKEARERLANLLRKQ
jgi:hypothetical protein